MTTHVRKQIRDAAVTALTNLTTTGANIFGSRVYQMQDAELPGLLVDTLDEQDVVATMGVGRLIERTLTLEVRACVKQVDTYNDTIDQICLEVEKALAANNTLGGLCKYIGPPQFGLEMDGQGEIPRAIGTMKFDVLYYTALATPDVVA